MTLAQQDIDARVQAGFAKAAFINDLGIRPTACGSGWVEAELQILPRHSQQNGFVHAGVQTTLADHSAGAAGATLIPDGFGVLSVEFKVNLLRPALCATLLCRAEVLKPGKQICVVEAEVFAWADGKKRLFSKATVTLAVMPITDTQPR
ncbi:MAG: PaaI family thioesterase [Pseudomonas neustonica]